MPKKEEKQEEDRAPKNPKGVGMWWNVPADKQAEKPEEKTEEETDGGEDSGN